MPQSSLRLRVGSLLWRCLLLLYTAHPVWTTPQEGTILFDWKGKLSNGDKLTNWTGASDPCTSNGSWFHVTCNSAGYVQRIDLGSFGLSGPLVPELGQLSQLQFLSVHNNSFNGSVPEELGDLTALISLDLSANQFSGLIPASLSNLTTLKNLTLESNEFSGSFPVALMRLYDISELILDSNHISGVLNITHILSITEAASVYGQSIGVLSLVNNGVTGVDYQLTDLLNNRTVIKLQGNPYCNTSVESYDEGMRCFCLQNCSITTTQEGFILNNWKNTLGNDDKLINWGALSDPCGINPWYHVLCNRYGHVQGIVLDSLDLVGSLAPELGQLSQLEFLLLSNDSLSGSIPPELGNLSALTALDLSNNQLSGSIPDNLENLYILVSLDLSQKNLSGPFPESLAKLGGLPQLSTISLQSNSFSGVLNVTQILSLLVGYTAVTFDLRNNNITDVVQPSNSGSQLVSFRLEGNPYCAGSLDNIRKSYCQQPTYPPYLARKIPAIVIGTVSGAMVLVLISVAVFKVRAQRKLRELEKEYQHKFAEFEVNPQPFLYNELRLATKDFHDSTKLGQGSFGAVYKGMLSNGNQVAIKKLKPTTAGQGVEVDDFLNEVVFITKMKHRNLVDLKGYCMRGKERMLVYEFIENMDVEQALLMGKNKEALHWSARLNICLGVAQGLHYLHTFAQPRVIHRDIKASNILLDTHYAPKIADFGLALLFPDENTHISTAIVAGTRGYLAPEYASYGELSEKADVYSFGVLCLEVVSGRKNIDQSKPVNQVYLPSWAMKLYEERKLKDLIDASLHLHVDEEQQALRVINTALHCLRQIPDRRPSMSYVQTILQGDMELSEIVFPTQVIIEDSTISEESALTSSPSAESAPSRGRSFS